MARRLTIAYYCWSSPTHAQIPLNPTQYHVDVCSYLERHEPELWKWGASAKQDDIAQVRLHLLKTTYELSYEAHPELHAAAARAAQGLGIAPQVSLYQSNDGGGANVAVYTAPDEAHIIFQGPVLGMLVGAELDAVLGHELAHYLLWRRDAGRLWIGSRIVDRLAHEEGGDGVWTHTAQRFQQYTEIYDDRGAYAVCADIAPCIAGLVKTQTGTPDVHVESYLKQADKVLAHAGVINEGTSHPQTFIRAKALALHAMNAPELEATLTSLLVGPADLDKLDILGQHELHALTRSIIARLLAPAWFGSDSVLALARRYFSGYVHGEAPQARHIGPQGAVVLPAGHRLAHFLSFVLLDFALADPLMEELPVAAALRLAQELDIADDFDAALLKETKMKKPALAKLKATRDELLKHADTTAAAPATN